MRRFGERWLQLGLTACFFSATFIGEAAAFGAFSDPHLRVLKLRGAATYLLGREIFRPAAQLLITSYPPTGIVSGNQLTKPLYLQTGFLAAASINTPIIGAYRCARTFADGLSATRQIRTR